MTDENKTTLKYYLQLVVTVTVIMGCIWGTMIRPAMREIAGDCVEDAQKKNDAEHRRIEQRTETELREIKDTLKSIDQRLWEEKRSP